MIGKRIRELRGDKTQRELAEYLSLTPKMISFYEKEERYPPHDILLKLSEYFNVSVDYLLGKTSVKSYEDTWDRIRSRREFLGLSAKDIASKIRISPEKYEKYESTSFLELNFEESAETLGKIAEILQTSPEYLLAWTNDPSKKSSSSKKQSEKSKELMNLLNTLNSMPEGEREKAYIYLQQTIELLTKSIKQ